MKKLFKNETAQKIFFTVLSFILAVCITGCALTMLLQSTLFNKSFIIDTVNSSNYYTDLCDEITEDLIDIGDASGLSKSFFNDFVDEVLVREGVQSYIEQFYAGKKLTVDTEGFSTALRDALRSYAHKQELYESDYDEKNLEYFISEATKIYSANVKITYLEAIQNWVVRNGSKFSIYSIILAIVSLVLAALIFFTNKWKHRAVRYLFYSFSGAGLFVLGIPTIVFSSGIIGKIAIISRSLRDLYTGCLTAVFNDMFIIGGILLVLSAVLLFIHIKMRNNAIS